MRLNRTGGNEGDGGDVGDHQSGVSNEKDSALYDISKEAQVKINENQNKLLEGDKEEEVGRGEEKETQGIVSNTPARKYLHQHRNNNFNHPANKDLSLSLNLTDKYDK